jgi:hypothetical protein
MYPLPGLSPNSSNLSSELSFKGNWGFKEHSLSAAQVCSRFSEFLISAHDCYGNYDPLKDEMCAGHQEPREVIFDL